MVWAQLSTMKVIVLILTYKGTEAKQEVVKDAVELAKQIEDKRELAGRQDESEKIVRQLNEIRRKVDDVKETQMFENVVEDAVNTVKSESENIIGKI